jgi:hypothetical protein
MRWFVRNKKGSLSLSMEAIVILILAVVMLGLGLSFIRTMFNDITKKASIAMAMGDLTNKPSTDNLIVFSPIDITIKEKGREDVQIGFLNDHATQDKWLLEIYDPNGVKCGPSPTPATLCAAVPVTYNMKAFTLDRDNIVGWYAIFQPKTGTVQSISTTETSAPLLFTVKFCAVAALTDTSCPTTVLAEYTKQLYIEVKR